MMGRVKVRKWARFAPPLAWAIALDAIDIGFTILAAPFLWIISLFGVGVAIDGAMDIAQGLACLCIFEDPRMAVVGTGGDAVLPPYFDIFPTYTAAYIALEMM